MAASTSRTHCVTCRQERIAYKCEGCSGNFCFDHLADHRRALGEQLERVEDERNSFRQTLTEQAVNPQKHSLIQQINKWEQDSINKIQQTADKARQLLIEHIGKIEIKLSELTEQLKQTRKENDFNEIHLNQLKNKLKELKDELNKPSNISIQQDSSSFINKISVVISFW
jgi:predicted  nucleic acid-binding Zn-ribbon protein